MAENSPQDAHFPVWYYYTSPNIFGKPHNLFFKDETIHVCGSFLMFRFTFFSPEQMVESQRDDNTLVCDLSVICLLIVQYI